MRRLILVFLISSFCFLPSLFAQTTQVTGQVKDVNGVPYAGASMKAGLVFPGTPVSNPTVTINTLSQCRANGFGSAPCQVPFTPSNGPFTLDSSGNIPGGGITLQDNTLVNPAGTQWAFTVNTPGNSPPLGTGPQTCAATITISGASQSVSASFAACPALGNASSGITSATGIYLSPNCAAGSVTQPCINIPAGGGCFQGVTTTVGGLVTYQSGSPSPAPVVGQQAWVQLEQDGGICNTQGNGGGFWSQVLYCGSVGGGPVTITAVTPGVSVQLSGSCTPQSGGNAWLFYGPNVYTQMVAACTNKANAHVAKGYYVLDNTGFGTASACGSQVGPILPDTLSGEDKVSTVLLTPPWYNHGGDLGTVVYNAQLSNITLDGTWTNLNVGIGRGTPVNANSCGAHDFNIIGYNYGNSATSEMLYPAQGLGLGGNCEIRNAYIATGNRGIFAVSGRLNLINSTVLSQGPALFCGNASNGQINFIGGYYQGGAILPNYGVVGCTGQDGGQGNGNILSLNGTELCAAGNEFAIDHRDATGQVRLTNVKINTGPICGSGGPSNLGTNAAGVSVVGKLSAVQTDFKANGTGNTVNNPAGATFFDGPNNSFSGGAGYTGAGSLIADGHAVKGSCTGVVTASQTLGLYDTGPNVTATTCTSTIIGTGKVVSGARTLYALKCDSSAVGVSASDVCIVLQNGANVGSCSLNGVTTCTAALAVALADGDRVSLQITTGVADTLANVKAIADWN